MRILRDTGLTPGTARQAEPATVRRLATSLGALQSRFVRDEQGSVGMIFGLMVIPCIMLVGFAVDFSRAITVKTQTQGILDNAALAGAKAVQVESNNGNYDTVAQAAAVAYWNAHKALIQNAISGTDTVTYTSNAGKTEFTWTMTQWVKTPFMSAGMLLASKAAEGGAPPECATSGWQCQKLTIVSAATLQAGGQNNDMNIEVSMMLDVTGSMSGQKITDLKLAAKDLIDIVVWSDQSTVTSKVGLAPFADGFNVGTALAPLVRGTVQSGTNPTTDDNSGNYEYFKFNKKGGGTSTYKISNACVTERTGTNAYTDVAPSSAPVGKSYAEADGSCSLVNSSDAEVNVLTPLSNNKTLLKSRIDKLTLAGSTAGQLGTAWAWYLLSPNFGYLYPAGSVPASYTSSTTRKIAVLMTDGEFNTQFWKGVKDTNSYDARAAGTATNGTGGPPPKTDTNAPTLSALDSAEYQALQLCYAMKQKGIEVFTVGFQAPTQAKNLLKNCSTDVGHFYDATTGDALRMAFRDIALKVSSMKLSK